jgi:hypothetical protein
MWHLCGHSYSFVPSCSNLTVRSHAEPDDSVMCDPGLSRWGIVAARSDGSASKSSRISIHMNPSGRAHLTLSYMTVFLGRSLVE